MTLQFDTASFPEQKCGMLVCGINWGGDKEDSITDPHRNRYYRSFFSDDSDWVMNTCKYRSRILNWLTCLGLRLNTTPKSAGRLEKSISQVNWLPTQSQNTDGQDNFHACVENHEFFVEHLRVCAPSLILFLSADLLRALNTEPCLSRVQPILGQPGEMRFEHRDINKINGKQHPRLKVGKQYFSGATVISLPHPAYRQGILDDYIAEFREWIGVELEQYARLHQ